MDSDTATESDLSAKSRSFLHKLNDRLRKMLNRSPEDSMQDIDKRSIWERITQTIFIPSKKKTGQDLTLKQMFGMSEK